MSFDNPHLPDDRLLQDIDGELPKSDEKQVRAHLGSCWSCRARRAELEHAMGGFVQAHHNSHGALPPPEGPRALLRSRLSELAADARISHAWNVPIWQSAAALFVLVAAALLFLGHYGRLQRDSAIVDLPDSRLTPGAMLLSSRLAVCAGPDTKNKLVPVALQERVFHEYGISGADPRAYEIDYLVTPALGGAEDIHNLWPHSYRATAWNAYVKDELEDHLRDMVCQGKLDLSEAQQEIAANWIAAYKKYFHTDKPLDQYCRRCAP